jgi:ketosteroid isomerase-like protein
MTAAAESAWIEKLAIREVISTYTSAATRGDWDALEATFLPDARWELGAPLDVEIVGARAIRDQLVGQVDHQDFFLQMTHDTVVTLTDDDRASAITTIHALARQEGRVQVTSYGIYYDDLVKADGAWRFARRRLQPIFMNTGELPGPAPISRSALHETDAARAIG